MFDAEDEALHMWILNVPSVVELPWKSAEDGLLVSCFKWNEVVSCEDRDVYASLTFGTEDKIKEISFLLVFFERYDLLFVCPFQFRPVVHNLS